MNDILKDKIARATAELDASKKRISKNNHKILKTYDPRQYNDEGIQDSTIWTSKSVEIAKKSLMNGQKLKKSPFFENNPEIRRANIVFKLNDEEFIERIKSMNSVHYFAEKYAKLKRRDGKIGEISLRDYQSDQLLLFLKHDRHIMLWARQAAKTTTACIYILHQMTFLTDKLTAILGNKSATSAEVLRKIKEIYVNLPFFLQAGVTTWNGGAVGFDNNCTMISRPCTFDALNGLSVYILYIDEFAFTFGGVKSKQEEFLANAQPVLSSFDDSKLIITSTPNGKDLFNDMFDRAVKGLTTFIPTKVYWWQIPGKDEQFKLDMISEIGEDKFKVQYELSFDVSTEKLLSSSAISKLDQNKIKYARLEDTYDRGLYLDFPVVRMHPKLAASNYSIRKSFYINTSDIAEGLGDKHDYTTMHSFKICHTESAGKTKIYFRQDLVYESNNVDIEDFSTYVARFTTNEQTQDNVRYLFEANKYGDYHRLLLKNIADEDEDFEVWPETFFKFRRSADSKRKTVGILTNSAIKKLSVKAFKKAIETDLFVIADDRTIEQVGYFQKDKRGNYNAEVGHDDLVTPLLHLAWLISSKNKSLTYFIDEYIEHNDLHEDWEFTAKIEQNGRYADAMRD